MKLIIDNENKKLSRNRKGRIERKIEMDDKMKSILKKNKTERKRKNFAKVKELEIELVKIKCSNNSNNLQSEIKEVKQNSSC